MKNLLQFWRKKIKYEKMKGNLKIENEDNGVMRLSITKSKT